MTRLERFGWQGAVEPGVGRVVSAHGDYYHLVCNEAEGEILARKKKSAFAHGKPSFAQTQQNSAAVQKCVRNSVADAAPLPMTGDFVRFRYNDRGDSMITEVLPRFSHFERKDPTARRASQTLAVNFHTLFIMMSLTENFSLPRLERFLGLAEDMGDAEAVVVLTKRDLAGDGADDLRRAAEGLASCASRPVVSVSAVTGAGLDALAPYLQPRRTVAFIGSSGVGKSTLLNRLAGAEWQATQEIQEWSGKGRHTTTSRELVMLPDGVMIVDTPGIREIGRVGEEDELLVKGESTHRYRK